MFHTHRGGEEGSCSSANQRSNQSQRTETSVHMSRTHWRHRDRCSSVEYRLKTERPGLQINAVISHRRSVNTTPSTDGGDTDHMVYCQSSLSTPVFGFKSIIELSQIHRHAMKFVSCIYLINPCGAVEVTVEPQLAKVGFEPLIIRSNPSPLSHGHPQYNSLDGE